MASATAENNRLPELAAVLRKYWGYDSFRPLQAEAMSAVMSGRDSVVVLPTGGGKSLCFQAPAMLLPGLAVVVSPLISLMKDQVDALADCGVPAACVNSTLSLDEKRQVANQIRAGQLKLLYLSPERLMSQQTMQFLRETKLSFIAIDEAHCISDWGHDFRPEYRQLSVLKETLSGVALHAYTATATERVRHDIARELRLQDVEMLVGSFDRPNLVYRVAQRTDRMRQIAEVIARHPDDSGIIYCIRRADVEEVCAGLVAAGHSARPYHAGMSDEDRHKNQDSFINDRAKIIVATVAFGMGIDKSDVRYVIHAGAPKSLENYQQESGRAGRDGLEAECCLFYSAGDFGVWRRFQQELPPAAVAAAVTLLAGMEKFCTTVSCRHRTIIDYFGQQLAGENCQACDVCLEELKFVDESLVIAQKILSCVLRLRESFGANYTAQVLAGSRDQRILEQQHDQLSTYGILSEHDRKHVRAWIEQLVEQGFLLKGEEYSVLSVTPEGREVLRGARTPQLLQPAERPRRESKVAADSWEGVDRGLFEALRAWRRGKAEVQGLPPYIVCGDATLRDLARRRPTSCEKLLAVHGIGEKKSAEYGPELVEQITDYCRQHDLSMDVSATRPPAPVAALPNASKRRAFELFSQGKTIDEVSQAMGRAASTTTAYLAEFVESQGISDPTPWLDPGVFEQIYRAAETCGVDRLKPIFDALEGKVGYDQIRIAVACLRNGPPPESVVPYTEQASGPKPNE